LLSEFEKPHHFLKKSTTHFNNMRCCAIIPARKNSKRIPGKNKKLLNGKPLICYTIEAALNSKLALDIVLSSDDPELREIAKNYGSRIMFHPRPEQLAMDDSKTIDVMRYVLKNLDKSYSEIITLQPTSPLRTAEHIDSAQSLKMKCKADTLFSVTESTSPPSLSAMVGDDLSGENFLGLSGIHKRTQDCPTYCTINGAIYINDIDNVFKCETLLDGENPIVFKMKSYESIDIDSLDDFQHASLLMRRDRLPTRG